MEEALVKEIVKKVMETMKDDQTIPMEVSARHVHLSVDHIEKLFGKDYKMTKKKELSQPGQFQYHERVSLIGPKGMIKDVAILGPPRDKTQVEISMTDGRCLGIKPPVRESGDLQKSAPLFIASPEAVIEAKESVIVPKRHIHMTPEDARRLNVQDKQLVSVRVKGERSVIFEDVVVRISSRYRLSMHIDFDEANAAGFRDGARGEIIVVEEGIPYKKSEALANPDFYNLFKTYEKKLTSFDGEVLRKEDLEVMGNEKNNKDDIALMNNKVIIESDISKAFIKGGRTIHVDKHAIITPLALDYIRFNNIQLIRK